MIAGIFIGLSIAVVVVFGLAIYIACNWTLH